MRIRIIELFSVKSYSTLLFHALLVNHRYTTFYVVSTVDFSVADLACVPKTQVVDEHQDAYREAASCLGFKNLEISKQGSLHIEMKVKVFSINSCERDCIVLIWVLKWLGSYDLMPKVAAIIIYKNWPDLDRKRAHILRIF